MKKQKITYDTEISKHCTNFWFILFLWVIKLHEPTCAALRYAICLLFVYFNTFLTRTSLSPNFQPVWAVASSFLSQSLVFRFSSIPYIVFNRFSKLPLLSGPFHFALDISSSRPLSLSLFFSFSRSVSLTSGNFKVHAEFARIKRRARVASWFMSWKINEESWQKKNSVQGSSGFVTRVIEIFRPLIVFVRKITNINKSFYSRLYNSAWMVSPRHKSKMKKKKNTKKVSDTHMARKLFYHFSKHSSKRFPFKYFLRTHINY